MEALFSAEFWLEQLDFSLKAWAIITPLFILVFWAGFTGAQRRRLEGREDPLLDTRLELAREQNAGEAKTIASIRAEIAELRKLVGARAKPSVLQQINELESTAGALVMANNATDHILTAQTPAIGH